MATIAPPNSFLVPQQAVQSGLSAYRPSQFGVMQPYVSDLLTAQPGANKYMGATYVGDPTKIQERLNQYSNISGRDLEGLRDYFSPLALQSSKFTDKLLFKKSDLEQAQSQLGALNADQLSALQQDLASYTPVGTAKGSTYYKRPELEQALSNYAVVPEDKWTNYNKYAQDLDVSPVTMFGNTPLLKKDQAEKFMQTVNLGEWLNKINSMRTREEIYQVPAPDLSQGWDAMFNRNNNVDPSSLGYQARVNDAGETEWYRTVPETPMTIEDFWATYGTTPAGGWSDSNTKRSFNIFNRTKPILQRWQDDASYLPNFSLYGSGSPEDIQRGFNVLQRMSPQNINEFWMLNPETQKGMLQNPGVALQQMRALANPANKDWLSIGAEGGFNSINAYNWDAQRGLTADPSQYMNIHDEGPFGDNFITDILDNKYVNTALSFIPVTAPYMAAYNAINAIHNDNPMGALLSAAGGVMSATGYNPASVIGKGANEALTLGLGKAGQAALGGALYGAGMGALRGGGLQGALTGALTGGLGGYAGNYMSGLTQGMSPLAQYAANIGMRTGLGGLSAALSGRNAKQGALGGLASGIGGALSGVIGQNYGKPFGAISNPVIQQMLANQLYKV